MNKILEGMNIIAKYEPEAHMYAGHDQIWFGRYIPEEMSVEDEDRLKLELGWFEAEDSWSHFC